MKQRDIYFYEPPAGIPKCHGIVHGAHPCVIISNDCFNYYSPCVNVVFISSSAKPTKAHVPIMIKTQSYILCEQIHTVSKEHLINRIGAVSKNDWHKVAKKLLFQLDICE
jgi:mRNA-degrading endonuclease toxin of MazEF toxin-antitoxin module